MKRKNWVGFHLLKHHTEAAPYKIRVDQSQQKLYHYFNQKATPIANAVAQSVGTQNLLLMLIKLQQLDASSPLLTLGLSDHIKMSPPKCASPECHEPKTKKIQELIGLLNRKTQMNRRCSSASTVKSTLFLPSEAAWYVDSVVVLSSGYIHSKWTSYLSPNVSER